MATRAPAPAHLRCSHSQLPAHKVAPRKLTLLKLKANLVSNDTLSHFSGLYGFPDRLRGAPHLVPMLRVETDTRAAMVEAYIAGVYFSYAPDLRVSHALPILDAWLRETWEPLYEHLYSIMKDEHDMYYSALGLSDGQLKTEEEQIRSDRSKEGMAMLVVAYGVQAGKTVGWEEEKVETKIGGLWRMSCVVDGTELGRATRAERKIAKDVSGWQAAEALGLAVSKINPPSSPMLTARTKLAVEENSSTPSRLGCRSPNKHLS